MLERIERAPECTIRASGAIEIRQVVDVVEDGVVVATLPPHRGTLAPGDDLSGQDPRVVAVAAVVWTPEVVAAYRARLVAAAPPTE